LESEEDLCFSLWDQLEDMSSAFNFVDNLMIVIKNLKEIIKN